MALDFYTLTLADVRRETADAVSLRFEVPPALEGVFAYRAGQHVTLRTELDGAEVRRIYSVCAAPHEGELRIAVKRLAGGVFSNWANTALRAGATLDIMPPSGHFGWDFERSARRDYVGIAAGSGITPVLSLLKTALVCEPESRFRLLYGNRTSDSIMFLEELAALKNQFLCRLEVYHFLSDEADEIDLFSGRLDEARYDALFPALIDPMRVDAFFVCGPGGMMDAAEAALLRHGVARETVLLERFTSGVVDLSQRAAYAERAAGLRFGVVLDGRRRTVVFDAATHSLLDSARHAGLAAPYACKAGVCATCRARLVSGRVAMTNRYGLSDAEVAQGYILTCQAVPLGDDVVIDYDG